MLLASALSVLVGVALGSMGGGGSILTVPILIFAAGLDVPAAIATSLFVVGLTSLAALVPHARSGNVDVRMGLTFGGAGMLGAALGGRLARHVPPALLLIGFALMMIATALAMLRKRRLRGAPFARELPLGLLLLEGAGVGLVTGLIGAGGGFLVVPALALLGGLSLPRAIGTSLLVIVLNTAAGLLAHLGSVPIPWLTAGAVALAAVGGALAGQRLTGRLGESALRKVFAGFVLVMAAVILGQQLPAALAGAAS